MALKKTDFEYVVGLARVGAAIVLAKWKNGKIVHERYYYDTGKQAS